MCMRHMITPSTHQLPFNQLNAPPPPPTTTTTPPIIQGSWTTFLSKVMSGQLEELAGGPLFLLLAKYYQKHGPVYKLMFGPR